jgi:hypothetical protein
MKTSVVRSRQTKRCNINWILIIFGGEACFDASKITHSVQKKHTYPLKGRTARVCFNLAMPFETVHAGPIAELGY